MHDEPNVRDAGAFAAQVRNKIDRKTKPIGALGRLEDLATRICHIQQRLDPQLTKPTVLVFAGDHGIAAEGVSAYPADVTHQMVLNFLSGGAAINVFARQNGFALRVVDAGVNHEFAEHPSLIRAKVRAGTRNFAKEPAMTAEECDRALKTGAELVARFNDDGCNVIAFGEMGIANTSSAAVLASLLRGLPLAQCVGRGTGLDDLGLARKLGVLAQAVKHHGHLDRPLDVLRTFGGYEIAMIAGGIIEAARRRMLVIVDGFIVTAALAVAHALQSGVLNCCVFSHRSDESGHAALLASLDARPLLDLGLRLGEGTGAVLAFPVVQAAVSFLNEMATFESAAVSDKVDEEGSQGNNGGKNVGNHGGKQG